MARPKVHTAEVRERLLDEAVRVVAGHGVGAISVRDVARAARTSTTAVYSLFGNKDGLIRGVLVRAFESFATAQEAALGDAGPDADIAGLGVAYVTWALANPRLYGVMFGETVGEVGLSPETEAAAQRAMTPLRAAVRRAIESGNFRTAEVDTVVASLWSQVHGMSMLLLSGHFPAGADPATAAMATIEGWRRPATA